MVVAPTCMRVACVRVTVCVGEYRAADSPASRGSQALPRGSKPPHHRPWNGLLVNVGCETQGVSLRVEAFVASWVGWEGLG